MENKPSDPNQTTKIVAEAMLKHLAPVFPNGPGKGDYCQGSTRR